MNVDLVKEVYQISKELISLPDPMRKHAILDHDKIEKLAAAMIGSGKINFYDKEPQELASEYSKKDIMYIVMRELVASSINYCYWYGGEHIRPGGASSTMMYTLVDKALEKFSPTEEAFAGHIDYLIELLSLKRFPMLEERKRHLMELVEGGRGITFARYITNRQVPPIDDTYTAKNIFEELIKNFPGFASDTFLKRASLFMIQIYRQLGWWPSFMKELFVPADYQLPMILKQFQCMKYSHTLESKIFNGKHIHKSCLMEVQLRAATIMICKMLSENTGWNIADVDTWLWTKRKEFPTGKIHLTVTTDY